MKFLPPLPLNGIYFRTKLRHKKRSLSSGQSFIRQLQLINAEVKSWQRMTKVALIAALGRRVGGVHILQLFTRSTRVEIYCQHHVETLC